MILFEGEKGKEKVDLKEEIKNQSQNNLVGRKRPAPKSAKNNTTSDTPNLKINEAEANST